MRPSGDPVTTAVKNVNMAEEGGGAAGKKGMARSASHEHATGTG